MVKGQPDQSPMFQRIMTDDEDDVMPPPESHKDLKPEQKELIKRWIATGAPWQPHWSFVKPERPALPPIGNEKWVRNTVDRFILARLEKEGLAPAPEADARTLARRVSLDLTGLPPSQELVEAFVNDRSPEAYEKLVDKLLQSERYGEHRARYWLDAARYGDTHGMHFDNYREMWPYRDWVVNAFNVNQPFDKFTVEQLAGDLLPGRTDAQLIATGFQRCNITTNEGGTIDEENLANYAADRVQTLGWVYMGLTTNCSQCHDHKFDPLTQKDYYSMAAFFRNTTQGAKDGNVKDGRGPVLVVTSPQDRPRWEALPVEIAAAEKQREERKAGARKDYETWLTSVTPEKLDGDVPTEGLVAHLPLNDGAGDEVAAVCGSPLRVKATGPVSWSPNGKLGPAPMLKAGSTFDLGNIADFERDQKFSYGAWIKAGRKGVYGGIIARMDEKGEYRGWDLFQADTNLAVHIVNNWPEDALKVSTAKPVLKPGQWQHVFVTYDGSGKPGGIKIYVDAAEQKLKVDNNTLKPKSSIRTETSLRVGQRSHTQVFESGSVQDARVYARILGAAEIKKIASVGPLKAILAAACDKRTEAQQSALYDHYLVSHDKNYQAIERTVAALTAERDAIKARSPVTHVQEEVRGVMPAANVLMRGQYDKVGEKVEAATPAALPSMPQGAPRNRLGLAQWVVSPDNPLTARVTVNRFWQEIFGAGIVKTAEDFGIMGMAPSHPELLDWLAVEFRESGWDVKALIKLLVMSSTYRQSAAATPEKLERDRDNRLLSRGPRYRMDAEMLRDYALAASGLLSSKMGGPSVKPYQPEGIWDVVGLPGGDTRNYVQDKGESLYRRTLYTFWKRMAPPPNMETFNAPARELTCVRRERTNTPLQALVTMNDVQFVEAARVLAQRVLGVGGDLPKMSDAIARAILCRPLTAEEGAIVQASFNDLLTYYKNHPDDARALLAVGEHPVDAQLDPAALAAWTMVCNQMLNLDEVLNK